MNAIIQYGSIEAIPLYNCSAHSSEEWSKLGGVRHPYFGRFDIVFGITAIILYIPILSVMFQTEYYRMSCFKIMICLGIVDMMALSINSVITGILAIEGAVWCTYPNFNYVSGSIVLGLWCCSCIIVLGLVANRLLEMSKPSWSYALFNGYRTYMMMIIPVIYGLYFSVYTNPVGFNSKYYTWLFDPMINDDRSKEYHNIPHSINNVLIVAVTCVLYAWLYFTIKEKMKFPNLGPVCYDLFYQPHCLDHFCFDEFCSTTYLDHHHGSEDVAIHSRNTSCDLPSTQQNNPEWIPQETQMEEESYFISIS
ncbi:unnamed protein product [Caenorhabditis brenneri]